MTMLGEGESMGGTPKDGPFGRTPPLIAAYRAAKSQGIKSG